MAALNVQTDTLEVSPTIELGALPEADRTRFVEAVWDLPPNDQLLLALLYVEGLTLSEAALVLDMTVSDVFTQHSVAMSMMRGLLKTRRV